MSQFTATFGEYGSKGTRLTKSHNTAGSLSDTYCSPKDRFSALKGKAPYSCSERKTYLRSKDQDLARKLQIMIKHGADTKVKYGEKEKLD